MQAKDCNGVTPLHAAAGNKNGEAAAKVLRLLVAAGGYLGAKDKDGEEPLHWAAQNQNAEAASAAVQVLVAAGADALAKDTCGVTPLRLALRQPNSKLAAKAASLLTVGPVEAVLVDLCGAKTDISQQLLPDYVAINVPLTNDQWACIPSPCPGLSRALPAALACSVFQARQVMRRLPPSAHVHTPSPRAARPIIFGRLA